MRSRAHHASTRQGTYALVLALGDESERSEQLQHQRTSFAIGVARTEWGPNFARRRVCQYSVEVPSGQVTVMSQGLRNPLTWPPVDARHAGVAGLDEVFRAVGGLPVAQRRVCELAFRWNAEALVDGSQDAFLKTWIAIETISMNGGASIRPLRDLLSRAYGITPPEITTTLGLGHAHGIRCRIVHDGELFSFHGAVLDHLQALFRDAARARLGLSCGRYASATAIEAVPRLVELARQGAHGR